MEELTRGIQDLHQRVEDLDTLLHQRTLVADLRERRVEAAHEVAEHNTVRIKRLWAAGLAVAFLWTPVTAYGAVWMHERVRNTCLPDVLLVQVLDGNKNPSVASEPWYCGMFPGTGRPQKDRYGPTGK